MSRLFTFGCSFTNYAWPTWADFLGLEFEHFENWGVPGIGNVAIANRVSECFVKNNITEDDTVVIQWSGHLRNDYHLFREETGRDAANGWKTKGSMFSYTNVNLYDKKWQDNFFDEESYIMLSLNAIYTTMQLVKSTNCKWKMTTLGEFNKLGTDNIIKPLNYNESLPIKSTNLWDSELFLPYKKIWDNKNWIMPIGTYTWKTPELFYVWLAGKKKVKWTDPHPSPESGIDWLYNILKPSLGLSNTALVPQQLEWISICREVKANVLDLQEFGNILGFELNNYEKTYKGY